jgi:hypothetical protein
VRDPEWEECGHSRQRAACSVLLGRELQEAGVTPLTGPDGVDLLMDLSSEAGNK